MQGATADGRSRQVAAETAPDTLQDVIGNPVVSGLRSDIARMDAKRKELAAKVGDSHPSMIELLASIAEMSSKLEQETRRLSASVGVTSIINESREAQVRQALEGQRMKVLRMKGERDELAVMQRDVEQAQRAYDGVAARLTQTSLESQTTQTNAMLLMAATEPSRASFPRLTLNVAVGAFVGVLLAMAAVLAREAADRRLRSVEDVMRELRLPVLGAMLAQSARQKRRSQDAAQPAHRRRWPWQRKRRPVAGATA